MKNKVFSSEQFGFISGRSKVIQLKVLDSWTKAVDNMLDFNVIYLDFLKAF